MLKHRLISGIVIGITVFTVATYMPPVGALLFIVLLSSVAQLEVYRFMRSAGLPVQRLVGVLCGAALITVTLFTENSCNGLSENRIIGEQLVLLAIVLSVLIAHLFQSKCTNPLVSVACTLFGIMYVPYLFNYFTKLAFGFEKASSGYGVSETGRLLVFYAVIVVKSADVGAFFVGRKFGKHKLFPRVSPGKTWEGFAGGLVMSVCASVIFWYRCDGALGLVILPLSHALIMGVLLSTIGVIGDLFESLLKRSAGAKDSGTKVPGMGGSMDVFDSLLFGVPAMYAYVRLFLDMAVK